MSQAKPSLADLNPGIAAVARAVLTESGARLAITSTRWGQHAPGSLHYSGEAVDLAGLGPDMDTAVAWILDSQLFKALTEGIHNPGGYGGRELSISHGKIVTPAYWGAAVWSQHRNHIHLARVGPVPTNIGDIFSGIAPVSVGGHPLPGPSGPGERSWDYSPQVRAAGRAQAGHAVALDTAARGVTQRLARWRLPR